MKPFGLRLHNSLPLLAVMLAMLATVLGANLMTMSAQSVAIVPSQGRVATEDTRLNVRSGPGAEYDVVAKLMPGDIVPIMGEDTAGDWYQIEVDDISSEAWVVAEFIDVIEIRRVTATPEVEDEVADDTVAVDQDSEVADGAFVISPTQGRVATEDERLNVRGGPGTGFDVVGKLLPGDVVKIKGTDDSGDWYQIQVDDLDGETWVMAEFIADIAADSLMEQDDAGASAAATPTASAVMADGTLTDETDAEGGDDSIIVSLLPTPTPAPTSSVTVQSSKQAPSIAAIAPALSVTSTETATVTTPVTAAGSMTSALPLTVTEEISPVVELAVPPEKVAPTVRATGTATVTAPVTPARSMTSTLPLTVTEGISPAVELAVPPEKVAPTVEATGTATVTAPVTPARSMTSTLPLTATKELSPALEPVVVSVEIAPTATAIAAATGTATVEGSDAPITATASISNGESTEGAPPVVSAEMISTPESDSPEESEAATADQDEEDAGEETPAGTPTTAATPTPRPTPSTPVAVTQPDVMNVRSGPSTNYEVITSVPAGSRFDILALSPAGDWYQVQLPDREEPAWIFAGLTDALGPVDTLLPLPQDQIPPEPTPPPAPAVPVAPASGNAPPPSGAGFFGYGVQAHMLGGGIPAAMDAINDMGFNWVKQQVEWRLFQSQPGGIGFGELSVIVNEAGRRNISVLFSVVNAPAWARESGFDNGVGGPPADPQSYANFVGAMAGDFCGTALNAIEIWNEQNLHYEWGNKPLDPAEYMNLLRAAYGSIKAACPTMLVISGALTPAGSNPPLAVDDFAYLEGMYQNGLANYSDGIGAHPSGYNVPASVGWESACSVIQQTGNSFNGACDTPHHSWSFRSTMEGYRNIMVVYGDTNKRVWPTEFGWAAGGMLDPRYAYANDNTFDEQAAWTVEAYQMMKNWGWAGPAFLWNLNFRVVADGTEKAQWGIVNNDYSPLPTYNALRAMPK